MIAAHSRFECQPRSRARRPPFLDGNRDLTGLAAVAREETCPRQLCRAGRVEK
jgi:hypothetical protein